MLNVEIRILLNDIEKELSHFAKYVNELEDKYRETLPHGEENNRLGLANSASESLREDKSSSRTALAVGFNLVKNVLIEISKLIDQFSSLTTARESNLPNDSSYLQNYYYAQYVYHIAFYLTKVVETNLSNFAEKLDKLASSEAPERTDLQFPIQEKLPKIVNRGSADLIPEKNPVSEDQDDYHSFQRKNPPKCVYRDSSRQNKPSRKSPKKFKSDYLRPQATIVYRDDSIPTHTQNTNDLSRLRSTPHASPIMYTSDAYSSEVEQVYNSESDQIKQPKTADYCKCKGCTNDVFLQITGSLNSLLITVQNLIDAIKEWANLKHVERPKHVLHEKTPSRKIFIDHRYSKLCCSTTCAKCCVSCRNFHSKSKSEIGRSLCLDYMFPIQNLEPFWMQINPSDERQKTKIQNRTKYVVNPKATSYQSLTEREKQSCGSRKKEMSTSHSEEEKLKNRNKCVGLATVGSPRASRKRKNDPYKDLMTQSPLLRKRSTSSDSENSSTSDSEEHESETNLRPVAKHPLNDNFRSIPTFILRGKHISRGTLGRGLQVPVWKPHFAKNRHKAFTSSIPDHETPQEVQDVKPRTKVTPEHKPLFAWDLKEMVHDKLGGFVLYPKKKSYSGEKKNETETQVEPGHVYPQSIVFKVNEFSNLLKEKLRDHFERNLDLPDESESNVILDMIIDCLKESSDFQPKNYTTMGEDATSEGKPAIINKSVKDTINIATQVPDSEKDTNMGTVFKPQRQEGVEGTEKIQSKKTQKSSCKKCQNGWQCGLTIHQCHEVLPSGILEIRHMNVYGKICVCFQEWDEDKELDDWRWNRNPFYDPTRVEMEEEASSTKNTVLKVIYGPEGTMVKESLAETRLQTVHDCPAMKPRPKDGPSPLKPRPKSLSRTYLKLIRASSESVLKNIKDQIAKKKPKFHYENSTITKLGRFFDDILKYGCGKGPPLLIKVRKKNPLNDAYDLLMAPSKISLNYYRSLRVLYVSDNIDDQTNSTTNFIEEDQSDKLFDLFERKLFSTGGMCLFEHPSEEAQVLYLNSESRAHSQWFAFAGAVLALAFIHQKRMNIRVANVLYKCLFDRTLSIHDLQEIDPLFYHKLMWMKENPISERKIKMTFMLRERIGHEVVENELLPNGAHISVTDVNKFRYIDLVVKWKLAERTLMQLKDLRRGFASVLEPCFLTLFTAREIQALIQSPPDRENFHKESNSQEFQKSVCDLSRRETW